MTMPRRAARRKPRDGLVLRLASMLIFAFLAMPIVVAFVMAVNPEATLGYPKGFSLRWFGVLIHDSTWVDAYKTSLITAVAAAACALATGTMFAYANSRFNFPGRAGLSAFALSPLGIPGIIMGVGLVMLLNPMGLNGTLGALIIAFTVITLPYVVRTVGATLAVYDRTAEEAALTLGADEVQAFFLVTLPMIAPGMISAAILAFVFAFGNLQVAVFLVGSETTTVPALMYSVLAFEADPTIAAAAVTNILLVTAVILIGNRIVGAKNLLRL